MASIPLGKVLVVGGCGLLGYHIISDLHQTHPECDIHVLDLEGPTSSARHENVTYHTGDMAEAASVDTVVQEIKPEAIFHVASCRPFVHELDFYMRVNFGGTQNLLAAARKAGSVKAFIYTSSSSVVHDGVSDMIQITETAPVLFIPQQREPYHHSKAMSEKIVLEANAKDGFLTTSLRPSGLFGPGDQMNVKSMSEKAKEGKFRWQIGDGQNAWDFTYIANAARAHVLAAQALIREWNRETDTVPPEMRVSGESFFITNDEPIPFWTFARAIGAAAGYPTPQDKIRVIPKAFAKPIGISSEYAVWASSFGKKRATYDRHSMAYCVQVRLFDITKAKERLGYKPSISIQEGINRSVAPLLAAKKDEKKR